MKIVKETDIEVVKVRDLKIADEILWSNLRCRVEKIDWIHHKVYFIPISHNNEKTEPFHN